LSTVIPELLNVIYHHGLKTHNISEARRPDLPLSTSGIGKGSTYCGGADGNSQSQSLYTEQGLD